MSAVTEDEGPESSETARPRDRLATADEPTGDIAPEPAFPGSTADAGRPSDVDAAAGASDRSSKESVGDADPRDEGDSPPGDAGLANGRCQPGSRSIVNLTVDARVDHTVGSDERFIYYQNALTERPAPARHDILALPRAVLFDASLPLTPITLLRDDYAYGALVDDGEALSFIAMQHGDPTNQGLFRVQKRERAAIESLPIHAQASDETWPGQLALDEGYFYLASSGPDSHSLRIVRFARSDHQREELWLRSGSEVDDAAPGALSLRDGDIALDANHVYFTVRVNQSSAPHDFLVYRIAKQGRQQTAALITTITRTSGGIASDGAHLYFSHQGNLEQLDLASGARERLVSQEGMRDLSYADGVLSWTLTGTGADNLSFFCL